MYFEVEYLIRDLFLDPRETEPVEFAYGGRNPVTVVLRRLSEDELQAGYDEDDAQCTVTKQQQPSEQVVAAFASLAADRLPNGSSSDEQPDYIDAEGNILGNHAAPIDILPEQFQSFSTQMVMELHRYASRTIKILRWRRNAPGHHNPIKSGRGVRWSLGGDVWHPLPTRDYVTVGTRGSLRISEQIKNEIISLVNRGNNAPIGHEMLRESRYQVSENTRSAIVIGVAAAEMGFKRFCIGRLPDTRWILENMQSSSLVRMIKEYLPFILGKQMAGNKLPIPDYITADIENGVNLRNGIVHGRKVTLARDALGRILGSIDQLLWLLDYYSGFAWAVDHFSLETKEALGMATEKELRMLDEIRPYQSPAGG